MTTSARKGSRGRRAAPRKRGPATPRSRARSPAFREHQVVRTTRVLPRALGDIPTGAMGVVIHAHDAGRAYEIEFFNEPGVVVTVTRDALERAE